MADVAVGFLMVKEGKGERGGGWRLETEGEKVGGSAICNLLNEIPHSSEGQQKQSR